MDDNPYLDLDEPDVPSGVLDGVLGGNESMITMTTAVDPISNPALNALDDAMDQSKNGGHQPNQLIKTILQKPSECAFDLGNKSVCSPDPVLNKMAAYIKAAGDEPPRDPAKLVLDMKSRMSCDSESCVLKSKEFIEFARLTHVDSILEKFFKPEGPADNHGLLSNFNIDGVLDQLQKKFPGFLHIPFQMRDFERVGSELARVDLAKKFSTSTTSFGVVLNTDWSHGGGIHWYCLYGEKRNGKIQIEYFNSSGKEPLPETQAWLQKTKHYLHKSLGIPVEIKYSTGIQFQNDDHSCGVYCLMYIWLRLEGVSNNWFKADTFNDAFMHKARKALFIPE